MNAFRLTLLGGCALALLPIATTRTVVATAASTLFESTPFILAGIILSATGIGRSVRWGAYLGCGCGEGPGARSLPALAATCMVLGPAIAGARFVAALGAARLLARRRSACPHDADASGSPLSQLASLLPMAFAASFIVHLGGSYTGELAHLGPAAAVLAGGIFGFALAPCGLGAVGLAASLHASSPFAAVGFLCVAGIADARALFSRRIPTGRGEHDALAYATAACACAATAARHGQQLVHPHFTDALWICTFIFCIAAIRRRRESAPTLRWAPALMLAAALITAPPPAYVATETTLADAFPGERIAFTGMLVRSPGAVSVVRYAITCCRADAAPVALRLGGDLPPALGGWVTVDGMLVRAGAELHLRVTRFRAARAPADPFIYR